MSGKLEPARTPVNTRSRDNEYLSRTGNTPPAAEPAREAAAATRLAR
jgi:hypothetical protein